MKLLRQTMHPLLSIPLAVMGICMSSSAWSQAAPDAGALQRELDLQLQRSPRHL